MYIKSPYCTTFLKNRIIPPNYVQFLSVNHIAIMLEKINVNRWSPSVQRQIPIMIKIITIINPTTFLFLFVLCVSLISRFFHLLLSGNSSSCLRQILQMLWRLKGNTLEISGALSLGGSLLSGTLWIPSTLASPNSQLTLSSQLRETAQQPGITL